MYCPNCGNSVNNGERFCNRCGHSLIDNNLQNNFNNNIQNNNPQNYNNVQNNNPQNFNNNQYSPPNNNYQQPLVNNSQNNDKKKQLFLGLGIGLVVIIIILLIKLISSNNSEYYFSDDSYVEDEEIVNEEKSKKTGKYSTVIITDNTYEGVNIKNSSDAYKLISKDSIDQKNKCPEEIKKIEDEIIKKYNVTAVNLCELNVDFAKELLNLFEKIYNEYPNAKEYLTNLTLINASMSEGYIAAFMPFFLFASSSNGYLEVYKTQILLNTSYFLNEERLESSVISSSKSGHFPPNTTKYSPVAHELGHYLSFIASMKKYKLDSPLLYSYDNMSAYNKVANAFVDGSFSLEMITEAYNNYKKDTNTNLSIDDWRGTISQYALAKDNSGNYIYDETIAEAFHDVYLNEENAKDASKYIIKVLKSKLGG